MIQSFIYCSLLIFLLGLTRADQIQDVQTFSWVHTKYLTRSNWSTSLKANEKSSKIHHSIWFIFNYLNYCGYCKKLKPGWEAAAEYASGWSRYIKFGATDCTDTKSDSNDVCVDVDYPQWRIYCPSTNSTQLAFDSAIRSGDTKAEDIVMWSIKKINKIAPDCYGKSWPIRPPIEPQVRDDLRHLIPKNVHKFQLFISDDVLAYSLYVLNNSKSVFKEPIFRLARNNPILPDVGIWKGVKSDDGQISLEQIDSSQAMQPFVLHTNAHSHSEKSDAKKPGALKPTVNDIDSALSWMVSKDIRRKLPGSFDDAKAWFQTLHKFYPGSETMEHFLRDLNNFLNGQTTMTSKDFQNYLNTTSTIKLPEVQFDHCKGSDGTKRGYTCTLWVLFHSMTVKQAILAEQNQLSSTVKPSDVIVSIREFVRHFFLCEECVRHFTNMTSNAENEIDSFKEAVLYLWRAHNNANRRLRNEETSSDPAWPKVPFPTKEQCSSCVRQVDENNDAIEFDENETFQYLKSYYSLQNIAAKKSSGHRHELRSSFILSFTIFSLLFSFKR